MMATLIALLAIPLVLGIVSYFSPTPRLSRTLTVIGGLASLGLAASLVNLGGGRISAAGGLLYADSLSVVLLLAIALVYATSAVFAVEYLRGEEAATDFPRYARNFYTLLNFFAFSMLLVPATDNLGGRRRGRGVGTRLAGRPQIGGEGEDPGRQPAARAALHRTGAPEG